MLVTEFGMVMLARPVHPQKAKSPMLVTEFGMVMLVKPVQPEFVAQIDNQRVASDTVEKC